MRSAATAVLLALTSMSAWATYPVGSTPPDFTCVDVNGESWNLYEHRGEVVLVNFGATW